MYYRMKKILTVAAILFLAQSSLFAQEKKSREDPLQAGEEVFVCASESVIFSGPSGVSDPVVNVREGCKVKVIEDKTGPRGVWTKVDYEGKSGYIRRSAIVKRELFIPSESAAQTKDVQKIQAVGATKGFNPQVEKEYSAKENLSAQFALLDSEIIPRPMYKANQSELARRISDFKKEGGLTQ